jgi:hypothetical protein
MLCPSGHVTKIGDTALATRPLSAWFIANETARERHDNLFGSVSNESSVPTEGRLSHRDSVEEGNTRRCQRRLLRAHGGVWGNVRRRAGNRMVGSHAACPSRRAGTVPHSGHAPETNRTWQTSQVFSSWTSGLLLAMTYGAGVSRSRYC